MLVLDNPLMCHIGFYADNYLGRIKTVKVKFCIRHFEAKTLFKFPVKF